MKTAPLKLKHSTSRMSEKRTKRPIAKNKESKLKVQTVQRKYPLDHLAQDGRIGVLALATDFVIEDDLR